ncbi:MAG: hypothetical protein AAGA80_12000 [Cyanobacteria bacterium P01_F01_bin.143]
MSRNGFSNALMTAAIAFIVSSAIAQTTEQLQQIKQYSLERQIE